MTERKPSRRSSGLDVLWTSGTMTGLSDAQLLRRFARSGDSAGELAFRELIHRHGPMVLAICRQILRHTHDVDDAFQATFLVLVRRARSIRVEESLGPWLCSVAYRTAQRARAVASRYRSADAQQVDAAASLPARTDGLENEVRPMLYEELSRLPERYRAPIVLCHLEGKTHEQAARLLHWPVGTLSGRLSRGRQLLRARLQRRGMMSPSAVIVLPWVSRAQFPVPSALIDSTVHTAVQSSVAQIVSLSIVSLTEGVLRTMFLRKLRTTAAVLLISALSGGAIVAVHRPTASAKAGSAATAPALVSSVKSGAASASSLNPDTRSQSQILAGPVATVAEQSSQEGSGDCSAECPLAGGPPPWCPITMAMNAITNMMAQIHSWIGASS